MYYKYSTITRLLLDYYSTIVQEFVEILVRWSSNGNVLLEGSVKNGFFCILDVAWALTDSIKPEPEEEH